jgi:ketosteroid isomerase-like protein
MSADVVSGSVGDHLQQAVQELLDKQSITEVLARFMRACDRGDPAALRACFHPDAIEDHGGTYLGPASDWVDSIEAVLVHPKTRMTHCMTNVLVEVHGDVAACEAYVNTTSRVRVDGELCDSITCSRLVDRFERRDGEWRIAHRRLRFEWAATRPADDSWKGLRVQADDLKRGGKYPDDDIYVLQRELAALLV